MPPYVAFGDGSSGKTGTYYGLVLIPEDKIDDVQATVDRIKARYGGAPAASLHCRELFHDIARKNSAWKHLATEGVIDLCSDILREVSIYRPVYLSGMMPIAHYPKRFRLRGKNGHKDLTHDMDEKWRSLWVYQIAAAMLDPSEMASPSDPVVTPNPKTQPWWRMDVDLVPPGYRVSRVFLDREDTMVAWFSKKFKWTAVAKELVIRGTLGPSHLPLQATGGAKHPLLDLADIFVWSFGRSFSDKPIRFVDFEADVQTVVFKPRGDELVFGGDAADAMISTSDRAILRR